MLAFPRDMARGPLHLHLVLARARSLPADPSSPSLRPSPDTLSILPPLSTPQGVMQGIAGSIDRFGQVFGPVVGGLLLDYTGLPVLMMGTGGSLATVSAICLSLILDSSSPISVCLHPWPPPDVSLSATRTLTPSGISFRTSHLPLRYLVSWVRPTVPVSRAGSQAGRLTTTPMGYPAHPAPSP
jgi:hypothetical protein